MLYLAKPLLSMKMIFNMEYQILRNEINKNISELEQYLYRDHLYWKKENVLDVIRCLEEHKNIGQITNDMIKRLQNIEEYFRVRLFEILESFIESDEIDIKKFIESKLNIENAELLKNNQSLEKRNTKLSNDNKFIKKYKENYNEDGSSKVIIENYELKDNNKALSSENSRLKEELEKYETVKYYMQNIDK
jgi:hypothetical protein